MLGLSCSPCDFLLPLLLLLLFFYFIFHFTIWYWFCHTSTWIRDGYTRVPHPEPPSLLPPCTIPLGHPSAPAPSILYRTWTGDSFLIWYYTCFNAILPNHPTLSLSHRVQKSVLYICVSFAVSHTGLGLSFKKLLTVGFPRFLVTWVFPWNSS